MLPVEAGGTAKFGAGLLAVALLLVWNSYLTYTIGAQEKRLQVLERLLLAQDDRVHSADPSSQPRIRRDLTDQCVCPPGERLYFTNL